MFPKLNVTLIGCALLASLAVAPAVSLAQTAASVRYHDKAHNDDHEWNNHEDQAYHMWLKERHRKDIEFTKLKASDQQSYWNWRHDHSDASLKIDIR